MVKIRIEPWKSQSVELLGVLDDDAKLFELKDTRIATKISGWVGQLRSKRIKAEIVRDGFWISWIGLSSLTDRSEKIRALSNRFFQTAKTQGCRKAGFLLNSIEGAKALPWVLQGLSLGSYRFDKYKSKEEEAVVPEIQIFVDPARLAQCRGTAHDPGGAAGDPRDVRRRSHRRSLVHARGGAAARAGIIGGCSGLRTRHAR